MKTVNINEIAVRYLASSKKSEMEVRTKLKNNKFDKDSIERCIEYMKELKYIDDTDYAKRYVSQNTRLKKYSIYELERKLLQKGINKDIIQNELDYLPEEYEQEIVMHIMETKGKSMENIKLKQYLLKRGFKGGNIDGIYEE